jgi:hypothetical protein
VVRAGRVDAVLVGDDLPELGTDLVAALTTLDADELTHLSWLSLSAKAGGVGLTGNAAKKELTKLESRAFLEMKPPRGA